MTDNGYSSFVKVFFQDHDLYLSEKSSTNGASSWDINNSGNRIMPAMNGTPITAVAKPDNQVPIRVFFINTDGFLADIFQDVYGGTWTNGSLANRRFRPGLSNLMGARSKSLSASWCSGESLTLFVEASDFTINAFQLSETKTTSTWSLIPGNYGDTKPVSSSDNFASVCGFDGLGVPPVFVNAYNGTESMGRLYIWFNNSTYLTFGLESPVWRPLFLGYLANDSQQTHLSLCPPTPHPSTVPTHPFPPSSAT